MLLKASASLFLPVVSLVECESFFSFLHCFIILMNFGINNETSPEMFSGTDYTIVRQRQIRIENS